MRNCTAACTRAVTGELLLLAVIWLLLLKRRSVLQLWGAQQLWAGCPQYLNSASRWQLHSRQQLQGVQLKLLQQVWPLLQVVPLLLLMVLLLLRLLWLPQQPVVLRWSLLLLAMQREQPRLLPQIPRGLLLLLLLKRMLCMLGLVSTAISTACQLLEHGADVNQVQLSCMLQIQLL